MNARVHISSALMAALALAGSNQSIWADGFRLPDQDAFATARGEAFVATADNASAIYYNPAGISQLDGWNLRGGVYVLDLAPSYHAPGGGTFDNEKTWQAAPQFFLTYRSDDSPLAYGVGVYAPYGLGLRWPQDSGFRTVGTDSALAYTTINPVVAWQVTPNLSVGAGLTINYADLEVSSGLVWPDQHNDQFRFNGNGWDVGFNLGALWKVDEKISIGASFRSSTDINFKGHTRYINAADIGPVSAFEKQRVDASTDVDFPLNAVFGISYRPTPKWNFEFDADYTDWGTLNTVTIEQSSGFGSLLPKDIAAAANWEGVWYYKFGVTRYLENGWSISAGYIYAESAVPDAHYTPLVADQDRHYLSVGFGHKGSRWDFDIAYQFGIASDRTVSGSPVSAIGQSADGRYEYVSHAVLATVGFHF